MWATKQTPKIDTQKISRRESKHATMENHQFTKEGEMELQAENNKMVLVSH